MITVSDWIILCQKNHQNFFLFFLCVFFLERKFRYAFCRDYVGAMATWIYVKNTPAKLQSCAIFLAGGRIPSTVMDRRFSSTRYLFIRPPSNALLCCCYYWYGMPTHCDRIRSARLHGQNEGHLSFSSRCRRGSLHDCNVDFHVDGKSVFLTSKFLWRQFSRFLSLQFFSLLCWTPEA